LIVLDFKGMDAQLFNEKAMSNLFAPQFPPLKKWKSLAVSYPLCKYCKAKLPDNCKICWDPAVEDAMTWKLQSGIIMLTIAGNKEWEQNQQFGWQVICKQCEREGGLWGVI